jgi:hypothetical protein
MEGDRPPRGGTRWRHRTTTTKAHPQPSTCPAPTGENPDRQCGHPILVTLAAVRTGPGRAEGRFCDGSQLPPPDPASAAVGNALRAKASVGTQREEAVASTHGRRQRCPWIPVTFAAIEEEPFLLCRVFVEFPLSPYRCREHTDRMGSSPRGCRPRWPVRRKPAGSYTALSLAQDP